MNSDEAWNAFLRGPRCCSSLLDEEDHSPFKHLYDSCPPAYPNSAWPVAGKVPTKPLLGGSRERGEAPWVFVTGRC